MYVGREERDEEYLIEPQSRLELICASSLGI